jgi:acyl transferase domain-containing protein/acyl carrier protein/SAM-dependent methyltransferase
MKIRKFKSIFSGDEYFFTDHEVNSMKILPGAAYLELARAAGEICSNERITSIHNVNWIDMLESKTNATKVETRISANTGVLTYEIFDVTSETERIVTSGYFGTEKLKATAPFDIDFIKKRLNNFKSGKDCYSHFKQIGILYGKRFRGIQELYYSDQESLARIELYTDASSLILTPELIDNAFQACVAFNFNSVNEIEVPYSVGTIKIHKNLTHEIWAYVKKDNQKENINTYIIQVLNATGEVLVSLQDFATLPIQKEINKPNTAITFYPVWNRVAVTEKPTKNAKSALLITGKGTKNETFLQKLQLSLSLQSIQSTIMEDIPDSIYDDTDIFLLNGLFPVGDKNSFQCAETIVFEEIKKIQETYGNKPVRLTVLTLQTVQVFDYDSCEIYGGGIAGLTGSLAQEHPNWKVRLIDLSTLELKSGDAEKINSFSFNYNGEIIAFRKSFFYQQKLYPITLNTTGKSKLKESGVYVLLGGAGGIGQVTSRYLIEKYNAQIVWLGRSPLNAEIRLAQKETAVNGREPLYICCDANNAISMKNAYQKIKLTHNQINGLFHLAIVLNDKLLINMTTSDFEKSYYPKSLGSHNFIDSFQDENLDFICFYSSVQSQWTAKGQANYASGCSYKDSLGRFITQKTKTTCYTINWGYWGETGIVRSQDYRQSMATLGIGSITASKGMEVLEQMLQQDLTQIIAIKLSDQVKYPMYNLVQNEATRTITVQTDLKVDLTNIPLYDYNEAIEESFRKICSKAVYQKLLQLGIVNGTKVSTLIERLKIQTKYNRLITELLRELCAENYIKITNDEIILTEKIWEEIALFNFEETLNTFVLRYSHYKAYANLLTICITSFNEVLLGTKNATDIIFPFGSMELVSAVYNSGEQSDYFNRLLSESVANGIGKLQTSDKIRILEIGAGTGGTSRFLFEELKAYQHRLEYIYTDVSQSFLLHAEQNFKHTAPYLKTQLFNIEKSAEQQGFEPGSFDILIGANVIHATKNIASALKNIKQVLKKDGVLILNELAKTELFSTLTFGLLDGWWNYNDEELRLEGSPGLSAKNWEIVFQELGFDNIKFSNSKAHLPQQIITCTSNGSIMVELNLTEAMLPEVPKVKNTVKIEIDQEKYKLKITTYLRKIFSRILKLEENRIGLDTAFPALGVDSILIGTLSKELSKELGEVSATNFFEYANINELAVYFLENHLAYFREEEASEQFQNEITKFPAAESVAATEEKKEKTIKLSPLDHNEPIAIIGVSGKYPKADSIEEFWENLKSGTDCITRIPKGRWDNERYYDAAKGKDGAINSNYGGFLNGMDQFDPLFFNISPVDAERMDPQERLFLQTAWESIEDAGYAVEKLAEKKTGVYVGVMYEEYQLFGAEESLKGNHLVLGGSASSIANRVSYYCNFRGPSMAIDTMCSSSLTAIHLACNDLRLGHTQVAIAGGVNITTHPNKYLMLSRGAFLSNRGKCESFGSKGEGFIPGEGVGAIVLKKLSDAQLDGDRIYAVIKGSSVNHGGKANGYTVPKPTAQAEVISSAIKNSGVNPDHISYIEAHGTGTSLGDPVEIAGLAKAFGTTKTQFCSIGSVKSNIGHCESAAGIAGVTKIILQLKYNLLVPSLHSAELNPNINFEKSPFKVQQKLEQWNKTEGKARIAGISSFGAGGSNAHLILEEFTAKPAVIKNRKENLILLSAKDTERLKVLAGNLKKFAEHNEEISIDDIAYTLQVGRTVMNERLAFVVADKAELIQRIEDYIAGHKANLMIGNANAGGINLLINNEAGKTFVNTIIKNNETETLGQLWINGITIDWNLLYNSQKPNKVSLPTYPFVRERYWFQPSDMNLSLPANITHQLLHENTSTLHKLGFTTHLTSNEEVIRDHVVRRKKILSGVAYLEMGREAGERVAEEKISVIKNIAWLSPVIIDNTPVAVHTSLFPLENGLSFSIYSTEDTEHCTGLLTYDLPERQENFSLSEIRARLHHTKKGADCYDFFQSLQLDHGPSFQGIQELHFNENEALSKITLTLNGQYVLQPGIMDSALQTCAAFSFNKDNISLFLPFSLKEVTIYADLKETVWCYAVKNETEQENKISSYTLFILNEFGEVLVRMKDFVTLPLGNNDDDEDEQTLFYTKVWKNAALPQLKHSHFNANRCLIILGEKDEFEQKIREYYPEEIFSIQESNEQETFFRLLNLIQEKNKSKSKVDFVLLYDVANELKFSFVAGLLRTATIENTNLSFKIISLSGLQDRSVADLCTIIDSECGQEVLEVCYKNDDRKIKVLKPIQLAGQSYVNQIKEEGVYVIAGGSGGIGRIVATEISKTKKVKIILLGRSKDLDNLPDCIDDSAKITYLQCDIENNVEVEQCIAKIKEEFGGLNGIIHSAGLIKDSFLKDKTREEARIVLHVKIQGIKNLDKATKSEKLDFILLFSSIASITGNAGQGDYAAANAYLDAFAFDRNKLQKKGKRYGKTISINWPLWEEGGMQVPAHIKKEVKKSWGIVPLDNNNGIAALHKILNTDFSQVIVFYGIKERIEKRLYSAPKAINRKTDNIEEKKDNKAWNGHDLNAKIENSILAIISKLIKLDPNKIRKEEEFGTYGFDSVSLTKFATELTKLYDLDITPTVFFNSPTVLDLAAHLIENYAIEMAAVYKSGKTNETVSNVSDQATNKITEKRIGWISTLTSPIRSTKISAVEEEQEDPIAIVGISGRFPGTKNLEDFWNNIKENKDLITEVPLERWDWKAIYGDPVKEKNKTKAKWGGFIEGIGTFDPLYFNISPAEAELMDPQQRITLQSVYSALEDAGIPAGKIKGTDTGVYIGCSSSDYKTLIAANENLSNSTLATTGTSQSVLVNRISYLLDLHGPSEPIDTACSSSLIAIHRAVENIRNGDCEMAIAGGVNALLTPELTLSFSQAGVLSQDGRCKTFDESANGYVRGEGVGIVILKKLSKAKRDGNPVYALIKGSAVNHGGKANTMTSPNSNAQKELLLKAYRAAKVDPRDVGYIEAHGTGTNLGDPVECEGLKLAFRQLYKENGIELPAEPHCALGSVKTNVGHLEAAAGIVGMTKLLYAIKNKTRPGNAHLKVPNPYLNFTDTPFYLQKETTDWETKDGKPRIAGISSFGAGGSNAHIVIEEYIPEKTMLKDEEKGPFLILLSAKNSSRLKDRVQDLLNYSEEKPNLSLQNIAYTLQVGREHMDERLAFEVFSYQEFNEALSAYLVGNNKNITTGNVRKPLLDFRLEGIEQQGYIDHALEQKDIQSLIQLWINGFDVDWNILYDNHFTPKKISLPTYPFEKKYFWVNIPNNDAKNLIQEQKLHPLVHQNESTLVDQHFTSIYSGQEPFLQDHQVNGEKMLPGVAYLELARAAGEISLNKKITGLREVTWLTPIRVNGAAEKIGITILEEKNDAIGYEIYSESEGSLKIHSKGKFETAQNSTTKKYDLPSLRRKLKHTRNKEECYLHFKKLGLDYGETFQGIQTLYYGDSEALSQIILPKAEDGYLLPPGVMDSALQTCAGLSFLNNMQGQELPFSVKEVNILGSLKGELWCYVEKAKNRNDKVSAYQIHLLNSQGEEVLSFVDFKALPIGQLQQSTSASIATVQSYQSVWRSGIQNKKQHDCKTVVLLNEGSLLLAEKLQEELEIEVILLSSTNEIEKWWEISTMIKNYINQGNIQFLLVYQNNEYLQVDFLSGFFKTAKLELPKINGKLLGVDSLTIRDLDQVAGYIEAEIGIDEDEVRYFNGVREVKKTESFLLMESDKGCKIKKGGVYIITGGFGGLGRIVAEHILKTEDVRLVILGKSKLDSNRQIQLGKWNNASYYTCDFTNKEDVFKCIYEIKETIGAITGVIHCAGITQDSLLVNKTKEQISTVFDPKINGIKFLDEAMQHESLDFMVLFSSITAVVGSSGQACYSAANAYLNSFARYRNELIAKGKRKGHTISIDWPLWEDGGIKMANENKAFLKKKWGMEPLPTQEGIAVFEKLLTSCLDHCVITFGESQKIEKVLISGQNENQRNEVVQNATHTVTEIQKILKEICGALLKIEEKDIDIDVDFTEYGVDSIMMMNILNALEERFEATMEPTIIVNYPTIELLAYFLASENIKKPGVFIDSQEPIKESFFEKTDFQNIEESITETKKVTIPESSEKANKIAVIGMACHLPGSDNIKEFWDNLKAGKELISDTPKERWDMGEYFSAQEELDKTYTDKGGFITNPGLFDAHYFKISDDEAISMDPQQRLTLELSRQLIANCGYDKKELYNSNTGVYIGAKDNNYVRNNYHLLPKGTHQNVIVNNISNMIAARVSDFYNFNGASLVIDTACSSSLVAIHQACEDILNGKIEMAIAGGISILVDAFGHIAFSQAKVLSRDGHSYVFDERAEGFVLGEGGGLVMLKEYEQAKRDGNNIIGNIIGSAVNNDGKTMGLTVPNKEGQKAVIQKALDKTVISPEQISYYEAHGTGTLLGDPIEVKAATEIYQQYGSKKQFCALGSVKSNVGHNMTAAGVTGLIKILLQMQYGQLVPTVNCENPHPRFKFSESPFYPNTRLKDWNEEHKIAAISSFGFGGTNCHLILEKNKNETTSLRQPLPVQRLSNKSYWLGEEIREIADKVQLQDIVSEVFSYNETYLKDHLVNGNRILLGTTFLGLATNHIQSKSDKVVVLSRILFKNQVILNHNEQLKVKVSFVNNAFAVSSENTTTAYLIDVAEGKLEESLISIPDNCLSEIKMLKESAYLKLGKEAFYQKDMEKGIVQGDSLQVIEKIHIGENKSLAELRLPKQEGIHKYNLMDPVLLNGGLVATLALIKNIDTPFLPLMIKEFKIYEKIPEQCLVIGEIIKMNREIIETNFKFCSIEGEVIGEVTGFVCKKTSFTDQEAIKISDHSKEIKTEQAETFLRRVLQSASSKDISIISSEKNFMDMGIDSSELIALVKIMEEELGTELYPTLFFEYQNLNELAQYLQEEYPNRFHPETVHEKLSTTN